MAFRVVDYKSKTYDTMKQKTVEDSVTEGVITIVDNRINQLEIDKTLQMTIVDLEDERTQQYKVKYQEATFYAYPSVSTEKYRKGQQVYVLVPRGDFSAKKMIIGLVDIVPLEYLASETNKYEVNSKNYYPVSDEIKVAPYSNHIQKPSYGSITRFTTDDNKYFQISAKIKTTNSTNTGNYGIRITFDTGENNDKTLEFNINDIEGNPYRQNGQYQSKIFILSGPLDLRLKSFIFFNSTSEMVTFSDVQFREMKKIEGVGDADAYLTLTTPQGDFFENGSLDDDVKTIQATFVSSGQKINSSKYKIYWFEERSDVDYNHENYNRLGGVGWEFKSDEASFIVKKSDIRLEKQRYKCVIVYNDMNYSQIITLFNKDGIKSYLTYTKSEYDLNKYRYTIQFIGDGLVLKNLIKIDRLGNTTLLTNEVQASNKISDDSDSIDFFVTYVGSVYKKKDGEYTDYLGTTFLTIEDVDDKNIDYKLDIFNESVIFKYNEFGYSPASSFVENPIIIKPLSFAFYENGKNILNLIDKDNIKWYIPVENTLLVAPDSSKKREVPEGEEYYGYYEYTGLYSLPYKISTRYNFDCTNNNIILEVSYGNEKYTNKTNFFFIKEGEEGFFTDNIVCKIVPNVNIDPDVNATEEELYPYTYVRFDCTYNKTPTDLTFTPNGKYTCSDFIKKNIKENKPWFKIKIWNSNEDTPVFEGCQNGTDIYNNNVNISWGIVNRRPDKDDKETPYTQKKFRFYTITTENDDNSIVTIDIPKIQNNKYYSYAWNGDAEVEQIPNIIYAKIEYKDLIYYAYYPIITIFNFTDRPIEDYGEPIPIEYKGGGFFQVLYDENWQNLLYNKNKPFQVVANNSSANQECSWSASILTPGSSSAHNNSYLKKASLKTGEDEHIMGRFRPDSSLSNPIGLCNNICCQVYDLNLKSTNIEKQGAGVVVIPTLLYRKGHDKSDIFEEVEVEMAAATSLSNSVSLYSLNEEEQSVENTTSSADFSFISSIENIVLNSDNTITITYKEGTYSNGLITSITEKTNTF